MTCSCCSLKNFEEIKYGDDNRVHSSQLLPQRTKSRIFSIKRLPNGSSFANEAVRIIDLTRLGCIRTISCTTAPPIDRPTTWQASIFNLSSNSRVDSAKSAMLNPLGAGELRPAPRLSKAITR